MRNFVSAWCAYYGKYGTHFALSWVESVSLKTVSTKSFTIQQKQFIILSVSEIQATFEKVIFVKQLFYISDAAIKESINGRRYNDDPELQEYFPYGKPGGGAPLRNPDGKTKAGIGGNLGREVGIL